MPNEKIIEFDLNFVPQGVPPIVHVHQYDVGTIVTLKPTLYYGKDAYDGTSLSDCSAIVAYARPDGTKQSYSISPTVENNIISFPLDNKMTAVWGPNVMTVGFQLPGNKDILWTQNFVLRLERHPIQAEDYIGSSAYDGMIQTLQQYVDDAYSSTPPGYEEHIRNIEEVMEEIEQLHSDINNSYDEATQYTDEKIGGLDSIYATLQDVIDAKNDGRAYAGQLVGDTETRILEDTNLLYTTKDDFNDATIGMQIYAEHVATSSVLEAAERLGIEFTDTGANIVETGALSAEISKRADEIKTTLSADFATKKYVDDKETNIMSSSESMIDQKANEINLTVRSNYESKDDANDKLLRSQSYTDSQIEMMSGSITQRVNAYTDSSLRNLKIGAANLLRGTNVFKTEDDSAGWVPSYNNGGWQKVGTATVSEIDEQTRPGSGFTNQVAMSSNAMLSQNKIDWFVDGKNYVAHMWIKKPVNMDLAGDKFLWFRNSLTGKKITYAIEDQDSDNNSFSTDSANNLVGPINASDEGVVQHTVDTTDLKITYKMHNPTYQAFGDQEGNLLTDTQGILQLDKVVRYDVEDESSEWVELEAYFNNKAWPQLVDVVIGDGQTSFTFAGLKIEEGNKITSWYPNEFDFTDFFSSRLIQTYDSVMSSVYGQYTNDENGNDIQTKWGSLSAYVNNVAGRVTTMASANYITVDDLTGSQSATHNVVTDLIKSTVSDNWENLDTINAQGADILTTSDSVTISAWARSSIKLGGPNILRATDIIEDLVAQNKGTWSLDGWYKISGGTANITRITVSDSPNNNITKGWRFTATSSMAAGNTDVTQDEVPLGYQKPYTMSCYVRVISGKGKLRFQSWRAADVYHDGPGDTGAIDVSSSTHGTWTRVSWTFTHDFSDYKDQTNVHFGLQNIANTACVMEICGLKLEYGNMATDWQESVYDTQAYVHAQIKVATDNINMSVERIVGRNIIENSKKDESKTHTGYKIEDFNLIESLEVGKQYTLSASINTSSERKTVMFYHSGGSIQLGKIFTAVEGTTLYVVTFTATASMASQTSGLGYGFIRVYSSSVEGQAQGSTPISGTANVNWIKLELGTEPTPWTPAMTGNDLVSMINLSETTTTIQGNLINVNGWTAFTDLRDGAIIENKPLYYLRNTNSAPNAPTKEITDASASSGKWTTVIPNYINGYYYFTCQQFKHINGNFTFGPVVEMAGLSGVVVDVNKVDAVITDWCYDNNTTYIDGGKLYAGTVSANKIKLGGEMTIYTNDDNGTTAGGYMGFGWGSDGVDSTAGMAMRSSDGSHYLHLSTKGAVLHADKYLQIYDAGAAVRIHNRSGLLLMGIGSESTASNHNHFISSQTSAGGAAPLTLQCSGLAIDSSNNTTIFNAYNNATHYIYSDSTTWDRLQVGTAQRPIALAYNSGGYVSDARLKHNIDYDGVPDIVDQLKPASFEYLNDDTGAVHYGFIAQDLLSVDSSLLWFSPDMDDDQNNYFVLKIHEIIPMLVLRCQKLQKQIDELKGEQ